MDCGFLWVGRRKILHEGKQAGSLIAWHWGFIISEEEEELLPAQHTNKLLK